MKMIWDKMAIELVPKPDWFWDKLLEKPAKSPDFPLSLRKLFQNFSFGTASIIKKTKNKFRMRNGGFHA
jgi:hypothetical protein